MRNKIPQQILIARCGATEGYNDKKKQREQEMIVYSTSGQRQLKPKNSTSVARACMPIANRPDSTRDTPTKTNTQTRQARVAFAIIYQLIIIETHPGAYRYWRRPSIELCGRCGLVKGIVRKKINVDFGYEGADLRFQILFTYCTRYTNSTVSGFNRGSKRTHI